jgi:hypothetical protein
MLDWRRSIVRPFLLVGALAAGHAFASTLSLPPSFEDRLVYYRSFDEADEAAEFRAENVAEDKVPSTRVPGIRGEGALPGTRDYFSQRSAAFSPHAPLTVSFWWALREDHPVDGGFGLVHLGAKRGYISHFSRGKGTWCALQRPAAILQVYSVPGIKNINGIYDPDLTASLDLRAGIWHHTALICRGATLVEVYTDGKLAWKVRVRGRAFRPEDEFQHLLVGTRGRPAMFLDEIIVLRRCLTGDEIATYVTAVRQMREAGYPIR